MNYYEIDDLLEQMAMENKTHFAPHFICQKLGNIEINEIADCLLSFVPKILFPLWEVECPLGDSDFVVSNPKLLPNDLQTCHHCGLEYYPDPERVWLAFNFNPEYVSHIKKKQERKNNNHAFRNTIKNHLLG